MLTMEERKIIEENLDRVHSKIKAAAQKSGRGEDDIRLIAVSKTVSIDAMEAVLEKKVDHFGENRVQELIKKYDILKERCKWHLIGQLQTNKVKYITDKVSMIHSVDRLDLAEEIQKRTQACNLQMDVLVQVNISGEDTKSGISPDALFPFLRRLALFPNIKVKGLMTIAPFAKNPEDVRWVFRSLKNFSIDINRENIDNINMQYLSMGMSADYEIAIEEGANIVRIGSGIFGERHYPER